VRGLFWILALFALAVLLALGAQLNDGYVLLVFPPWRVELSLNLFGLALVLLFAVLYGVSRGIAQTLALPRRAAEYRARRQREKASLVFQDAVRLLFEGRFGQALKKAAAAHAAGTAPGLSALIAARAAQRMRESGKQRDWMERAKADDPRTEAATLMLEAEMMNEARCFDEALLALEKLQARQGRHIAPLRLELRARQGTGDWDGVLKLVRQLAKRAALAPEVVREIKTQAHLANIARAAGDARQLTTYLRNLPDEERDRRVVLAAVRALAGADGEVQQLIETALDDDNGDSWQSELAAIYGRLSGGDQTARLARAEHWLLRHADDAILLLALGRMCGRQRLWGKAENYLDASLAVAARSETHLELARLFEQLQRQDDANRHYRASALLDVR